MNVYLGCELKEVTDQFVIRSNRALSVREFTLERKHGVSSRFRQVASRAPQFPDVWYQAATNCYQERHINSTPYHDGAEGSSRSVTINLKGQGSNPCWDGRLGRVSKVEQLELQEVG